MAFLALRHKSMRILALAVALSLTGCALAPPPSAPSQAASTASAGPSEAAGAAVFLRSSLEDFSLIDSCLADECFTGLTSGSSPDSDKNADDCLAALAGIDGKVKAGLGQIRGRAVPGQPDLASFQASEAAEFETADGMIEAYTDLLRYNVCVDLLNRYMAKIGSIQPGELQSAGGVDLNALASDISKLQNANAPASLKSMYDSMAGALSEMYASLLYAQNAVNMGDPVRLSAAQYDWGLLVRRFRQVCNAVQQDAADRQESLRQDYAGVKKANDALRIWAQGNINNLSVS